MLRTCLLSLVVVTVAASHVLPDDAPPKAVTLERFTIPLMNQPAADVAKTLNDVLATEPNVRIKASVLTNILIIEAPPSKAPKILELIREMDHRIPMITIEAIAVELEKGDQTTVLRNGPTKDVKRVVADLQKRQVLRVIDRLNFTTISNQEARIQLGQRVGQTVRVDGRVTREYYDIGVVLRCIARAARDGSVTMDITYKKSRLAPSKPTDDDDAPPMTEFTTELRSTVRLHPDESVILGGLREDTASDENVEWRLIISAQVE